MDIAKKPSTKTRTGEILLESGTIGAENLTEALKIQSQVGGNIGSLLVEMGYLTLEGLLAFLNNRFGVPSVNLYELDIEPSTVNILPFDNIEKYKVLPIAIHEKNITLAMVNPNDHEAVSNIQFILGKSIQPVVIAAFQMDDIIKTIRDGGGTLKKTLSGAEMERSRSQRQMDYEKMDTKYLFRRLAEENASDLLLSAGIPPCIKKDNELIRLSLVVLTPSKVEHYARELMSDEQWTEFQTSKELDFATTFSDIGRFRINIYKQRHTVSISARRVMEVIPSVEALGLPSWIEDFALKTQGLILITGPVGHGKTTSLAALVDIINTRRRCNIITIEDPIEYLHKHKASNVNQREVGIDTASFHDGLTHIFRQAPDVIVIGEIRDSQSAAIALHAAGTGHLVLSTLHSSSATGAIDSVIDLFPPNQQHQTRVMLAEDFTLIINQRLVSLKMGPGRVLAYESLINSYRVKNAIRDGKANQLRSSLQHSVDDFISLDHSLARLCAEGNITYDTGLKYADSPSFFNDLMRKVNR
ncbi:MAG: PilT/PilU family type 4a pilus ATPase [Dissulfurispiraceae bacterium]